MEYDVKKLHPQLRTLLFHFLRECKEKGYEVKVIEGYRNEARQNVLYSQGRTNDKHIVTHLPYPYSLHNWGLAFHICRNDGKGYYSNHGYWFEHVAKIAGKYHFTWGGNSPILPNMSHFHLDLYGSNGYILEKNYGSPERFMSTWGNTHNSSIAYDKLYLKFARPSTNWIRSIQKKLNVEVTGSISDYELILSKTFTIHMSQNCKHKIVLNIQRRLYELGYYNGKMDCVYGIETKTSIQKLQEDIGLLRCDGIIHKRDVVWKVLLGMISK